MCALRVLRRSMYLQALRVEAQADGVLIPLVVNALKAAPKNLLPLFTVRSLLVCDTCVQGAFKIIVHLTFLFYKWMEGWRGVGYKF